MTTEIDIDTLLTNIVRSEHKIKSIKGIDHGIQIMTDKGSIIDWYAKTGKAVIRGKAKTKAESTRLLNV